ncbi:MAG: hypothetical protein Q8Q09_02730 [Deltaproteobacteria bacterium]|nr:hypothetical protein [Deltaproteobacteria bacterium]
MATKTKKKSTARPKARKPVLGVAARSSAMASRKTKPKKRAQKAHEVYAVNVGGRLSKVERDVKSLASGQSTLAKTVNAHHELLRVHHERIGKLSTGLRSLLPAKSQARKALT